jgi:hypothetical protein
MKRKRRRANKPSSELPAEESEEILVRCRSMKDEEFPSELWTFLILLATLLIAGVIVPLGLLEAPNPIVRYLFAAAICGVPYAEGEMLVSSSAKLAVSSRAEMIAHLLAQADFATKARQAPVEHVRAHEIRSS